MEGRNLLVEEFGREYGTYFSILELIAVGKTARSEIESVLEIHSGAYLAKLEDEYALIAKHRPINAKPGGRLQKYYLRDNFLSFWFRFIYRNLSAIETGNFGYVREWSTMTAGQSQISSNLEQRPSKDCYEESHRTRISLWRGSLAHR